MKLFARYIALLVTAACFAPLPCLSANPTTDWSASSVDSVKKAAEGGNADAQWYLGHCYCTGQKAEQNLVAAVQWFRKAAEQNNREAQFLIGWCYGRGKVVMKDDAEAVKWWRKAAEQNHCEAEYNLGLCYHLGTGVTKDEAEAVKLFRKTADRNNSRAYFWLGVCYLDGLGGLTKDAVEGYKWILLSASADNPFAKRRKPMTESLLTPEQIAKGQQLAREFATAHPQSSKSQTLEQLPGFPNIQAILQASPTNGQAQPTQQVAAIIPSPQPTPPAAKTALPPAASPAAGSSLPSTTSQPVQTMQQSTPTTTEQSTRGGLSLSREWQNTLEKGSLVLGELRQLLDKRGEPAVDLSPHPEIMIYKDIYYLEPFNDACKKFGKSQFSAPVQLGCPGFPEKSFYYYAFDGEYDDQFTRLLIVADLKKQVVAVEFTDDTGKGLASKGEGEWKVQDFVRLRMKGITSWNVTHNVYQAESGSLIIDSSLHGKGRVLQRTRLFLPRPIVNLVLFRLSGQKYHPPATQ